MKWVHQLSLVGPLLDELERKRCFGERFISVLMQPNLRSHIQDSWNWQLILFVPLLKYLYIIGLYNWKDLNWKYPWSQSLISLGVWHPSSVWAHPVYISTFISSHFSTLPSTQPSWPWMFLLPDLCKGSFLSLGHPPRGPDPHSPPF